MVVSIGTSGWSYPEWAGRFYVNNRVAKLPYYSRVFRSVEVDSSFYKPPSKSMVVGWAKATPPSFKFSLLLPSSLADFQLNQKAERDTRMFLENIKPLAEAEKLGCLLLHLPNAFTSTELALLESRLELLPNNIHLAIEFGHESWGREEAWRMMKRYKVATAISDYYMPCPDPVFTANTHAYVRWHGLGRNDRRNYSYSTDELATWVEKLRIIEKRVPTVYAYFCNHPSASAPANLLRFLETQGELSKPQSMTLKRYMRSQRKPAPRGGATEYF